MDEQLIAGANPGNEFDRNPLCEPSLIPAQCITVDEVDDGQDDGDIATRDAPVGGMARISVFGHQKLESATACNSSVNA